jgi:anaerobic selenocysteine-containing dehydrogenase
MKNLPPEQAQKRIGMDRYPIMSSALCLPELIWEAILEEKPYPVKAVGLFGSNAACAYANSPHVVKALSALDFLFVADYFHTPTTALADLILPPAHWAERDDIEDIALMGYVFCQPKAVDPIPECRDEKQFCIDLAKKMGLEGYWDTIEEALDYRLAAIGMRFEEFKKIGVFSFPTIYESYKNGGFLTPSGSGKVDLYSEAIEKTGNSPLPIFSEPAEGPISTPDLYKDYPLILTTGARNIVYYHSAHRNIPSLRKRSPDPQLDIHPTTAAEFQMENGEWVWLTTPRGHVEIKIRFNEGMHPKVVSAPHGYWHGVENGWRKININMITDNRSECPVVRAVPTRALLCRIEKVKIE